MRRTFHHAANTPQLHLRNASALTHNRFFLYRRHIQILGSSSLLYDSSGPSTARKICGPHQYGRTHICSTVQTSSWPQPHRITSHPDHKPHPTITRIQTPIVSDRNCIGSTVAHHGPSHKLCSRRICKQRSMAGYGILHARTGFKLSEDGAFPEDGRIVKVFPLYNQPLPLQR